jgi:hypothetical protein
MKIKIGFLLLCLLSACSTASPVTKSAETSTVMAPNSSLPALDSTPARPAAKTIVTVSNTGSASSEIFSIPEKGIYRVNWQQSSTGDFLMKVNNMDPAQAGTQYGSITFEFTKGPSARFSDYQFIAGQYQILVEKADGPWKVWVEYIGNPIQ